MNLGNDWPAWWRRFLGSSQDNSLRVVDILRQRYVEEMQQHDRLKQHAQKMHYPQFRKKLLEIASKNNEHAERIAQKILALGGKLPSVPELHVTGENSWQQLLTALEEDHRSADHLTEQLRGFGSDHPEVTQFLQQISLEQKQHRDEIREMLMRSDPFAFSLA
jgi:bacterioferritin (cytochrome b1)